MNDKSKKISVFIAYNLRNQSWGGGNQFLNLLKKEFIKRDIYQEDVREADILLFNSYQNLQQAIKQKIIHTNKFIVFRLGPIFYYHRGSSWKTIDKLVIETVNKIADSVIFQSNWSFVEAVKLGFNKSKNFSIIF